MNKSTEFQQKFNINFHTPQHIIGAVTWDLNIITA